MATTVVAYASGDPDPIGFPSTPASVLEAALPGVPQLYGAGVDSSDGAPVFTWLWSIISTNYTGAPVITTPLAQNTTVTVDEWVNIRMFLVITNTNNAKVSEADPALAPDSAFVVIRVRSTNTTLDKLADGERNFIDRLNLWPDRIDIFGGAPPAHNIDDHDTAATGAQLDTLTDGSNATGLHTHSGADVVTAGVGVLGVVELEAAPVGVPKMITQERLIWTASTFSSIQAGPAINTSTIQAFGATDKNNGIFYFRAREEVTLIETALMMNDGGVVAPATDYEFVVEKGTFAQFDADAGLTTVATLTGNPTSANGPMEIVAGSGTKILAGEWVRVRCSVTASTPGYGLHATLTTVRLV